MKLLDDFLKEISTSNKQYELTDEGLFLTTKSGYTKIAKYFPDLHITGHRLEEDEFLIDVQLTLGKKEDEIPIPVRNNMKIDLSPDDDWDILDVYRGKGIKDEAELKKVLFKYIQFAINKYVSKNPNIYAKCGWFKVREVYEFKAVTYRDYLNPNYFQDMFGKIQYCRRGEKKIILTNNCKTFLDFVKSDKNLIGIFSYTLHSVLWDFKYEYNIKRYFYALDFVDNKDTVFFSACIHGRNPDKAQLLANILSNLFQEPTHNWERVLTNRQHISATSIDTKIDKLKFCSSVPIIVVAPKSHHIIKSTKVVKEIHNNRRNHKIAIFPVYISDTSINVDEMVNFCIDNIQIPFSTKDKEIISEIHNGAMELLYYFLCYLRDAKRNSKEDDTAWKEISNNIELSMQELGISEDTDTKWLQDNLPIFLLYTALHTFCFFLQKVGFAEDTVKLKALFQKGFIQLDDVNDSNPEVENTDADVAPIQYLLCMNKLINVSMNKKVDWMYFGNEPRGDKEKCYYLEKNKWYEPFSKVVQTAKLSPISESKMIALLNQNKLLKRQRTSTANGVKRKGKYYLAIFEKEFNHIIQQ